MPSAVESKDEPEVEEEEEEEEEDDDEEEHQQNPMKTDKKDLKNLWSEKATEDNKSTPAALLGGQKSQVQADKSQNGKPGDLVKKTEEIPPPPCPNDNILKVSSSKKSVPSVDIPSWTNKQKSSSQFTGKFLFLYIYIYI